MREAPRDSAKSSENSEVPSCHYENGDLIPGSPEVSWESLKDQATPTQGDPRRRPHCVVPLFLRMTDVAIEKYLS